MADKIILRPSGLHESKLSTSCDSAASDSSHQERVDFFSGVRKGIKKLGSISSGPRAHHHFSSERSNSSLEAPQSADTDRPAAAKKGHARSTSDLGKPLPATPVSPTIEQLLRAPFSPQPAPASSRPPLNGSRSSTMDSNTSVSFSISTPLQSSGNLADLNRSDCEDDRRDESKKNYSASTAPSPSQKSRAPNSNIDRVATPKGSSQHLSGLMCNVHRTTGREPPPLVGATTTILGDKLYVFGGRVLSRKRPVLTADLYEIDLIYRHWLRVEMTGDIPPPRYFHSVCALGDTKLVCFGGMSQAPTQGPAQSVPVSHSPDVQPEVIVMSDIYVYDASLRKWTFIHTPESPQGRYAHCITILPSSATSSTGVQPNSAINSHSPHSFGSSVNSGLLANNTDGFGGAEMVVVGGQDSTNHYIEQISVFNFRSLRWTSTQNLGKSCGAYRSVVAPISSEVLSRLGKYPRTSKSESNNVTGGNSSDRKESGSSMLIYSNYNFLDVKLELYIRSPDGTLTEQQMQGTFSPPGLRFPNGGVIDNYFVVSGTYLTSSKQEYALWALELKTLTWSRIDAGGSVFSQGSWNRGVLWNRRNTFVVLGSRKRSLVEDYNHRRINFTNICMVELEAFGLYDNPLKIAPMSSYVSASSPFTPANIKKATKNGWSPGGRILSPAAEELGQAALGLREISDSEILCVNGERIPFNSRIVAKRWGPFFIKLLKDGTASSYDASDAETLRPPDQTLRSGQRDSSITITPNNGRTSNLSQSSNSSHDSGGSSSTSSQVSALINPPDVTSLPPISRPRILYLPHTKLTVQALLYYLYTSTLPEHPSSLCTPQILCSLLQIARPYQIDGLLESVVERLHFILDFRNAAAVFNASAMAAGGRSTFSYFEDEQTGSITSSPDLNSPGQIINPSTSNDAVPGLTINTSLSNMTGKYDDDDDPKSATESIGSDFSTDDRRSYDGRLVWGRGLSAVIGLQKRGLRGLMEGRRLRERGTSIGARDGQHQHQQQPQQQNQSKVGVGLSIAG
ncbi:Protein ral2 [Golovinomyces cichoracearum]|uniref:Protein ral2 n=1 Tax=Golovinomyces cichoracearum TaxID=62708 RepID=A0A420H9P8_9PEZI|nr:Protein ral2 [Golovinomyces cichoracearum]